MNSDQQIAYISQSAVQTEHFHGSSHFIKNDSELISTPATFIIYIFTVLTGFIFLPTLDSSSTGIILTTHEEGTARHVT